MIILTIILDIIAALILTIPICQVIYQLQQYGYSDSNCAFLVSFLLVMAGIILNIFTILKKNQCKFVLFEYISNSMKRKNLEEMNKIYKTEVENLKLKQDILMQDIETDKKIKNYVKGLEQ